MWLSEFKPVLVLNVAVTVVLLVRVTTHVPVPEQSPPDHPPNVEPVLGTAVSVTEVPLAKLAVQFEPQLIPSGELVTVPLPDPDNVTVRVGPLVAAVLNVAVTDVVADAMMLQVPVPEHPPPDHPANVEPDAGVAVSATAVPDAKLALHVCPQLIPAGALVTDPDPPPAFVTVI